MKEDIMNLIFRTAVISDLNRIVQLLVEDELGKTREESTEILDMSYIKAFKTISEDKNQALKVVELDGEIIGTCHLTIMPSLTLKGSTRMNIEAVKISEEFRGKKIGAWMISQAVEFARQNGVKLVHLTTNKKRSRDKTFYERLGFEATQEGMKKDLMNYFDLLEIDQTYDIDLKLLSSQYFVMQKKYHPDRAKDNLEKAVNLSISMDLNKAYSTLLNPLKRAEYLLTLNDIDINKAELRDTLSKDQLQKIWDQMEIVDAITDSEELEKIYDTKISEKTKLISDLALSFKNNNLQNALDITLSLKYLVTLIDNIKLKIKHANNRNH
jgi:Fe-S protein assembly co-chaperone HscB